ncbi:carbohydrate-binding module family 18 protein [Podospora didyma]|uniref:Carbohydrate-binding module family 18 protein n=1 Tax=Podospora didyma TaxID=330526 RepID=A0AAE0P0V2_9PEZI|nr:carbohydrate-binding module family 18 protein [Podospora didyma]
MVASTLIRGLLACALVFSSQVCADALDVAACGKSVTAKQGDTCASLAEQAGITVTQFIRSNPGVASCSELVAGVKYCLEGTATVVASVAASTSSPPPAATSTGPLKISTDGTCGAGVTCAGSSFGACCSEHGFCGSTTDYCGAGCQAGLGSCGAISSAPVVTTTPAPVTCAATASKTVTVTATSTITSNVGVTRTTLVIETSTSVVTSIKTNTALQTGTAYVTATAFVTNTVQLTSTVLRTATATATATVQATSIITITTISTSLVVKTSTATTTKTAIVTSVEIDTLTTIVTSTLTRTVTSTAVVTSNVISWGPSIIQPSPTPTRPSLVTPSPTLPGTVKGCTTFDKIREPDTCRKIANRAGLTLLEFYRLNPSVSNQSAVLNLLCTPDLLQLLLSGLCQIDCDNLGAFAGYNVCVAT